MQGEDDKVKVLVDFAGHADLYYSMHLLFEKRLGFELYRPTNSEEWQKILPWTSTLPPDIGVAYVENDIERIPMPTFGYEQKLITFNQFKEMHFDFIVATCSENEAAVCKIVKNFKPTAKAIRHIANIHEVPRVCKNVLLSTLEPMPPNINWIRFSPEHRDAYRPLESYIPNFKIKSFFNYMPSYKNVLSVWNDYKNALKEFTFLMHGGDGFDLAIPHPELPEAMQDAMFIWHTKPHGSCGYVARQALSCGKPLIVNKSFARKHKTLASEYLVDGKNCIDIDPAVRTMDEAIAQIRAWSTPEIYKEKSQEARDTITKHISFEMEAKKIKDWLERLS